MARILFYSPFNQRSRDTETLMIAFKKQGHSIFSLSQQEGLQIHPFLEKHGVITQSLVLKGKRSGWWYFLRHIFYFIFYCRKNKIDVVYSHLEPANFVAAVGQYLINAKVYLCRHHINEGELYNFNKDWYYKITYKLAKKIIVVSDHAKRYMVQYEAIPEHKIIHINLAYDFSLYPQPDPFNVDNLRSSFGVDKVLLVAACRLTKYKRPDLLVETVAELRKNNINSALVLLGKGEMEEELRILIRKLGVEDQIIMPGYVTNVIDYVAACDFFLHPSLLESSCVVIKEAGLVKKPVIVCSGIGDFNDYLTHENNAFLTNSENYVNEAVALIEQYRFQKEKLTAIGEQLFNDVHSNFGINRILSEYQSLNRKI